MAKKLKLQMSPDLIMSLLPQPPDDHSYRVEQFSALVYRVLIINEGTFSYKADDEEVKAVWGFVKSNGDVMRPKKFDKISTEKVCHVTNIPDDLAYSSIVPKGPRSLLHL